MVCIVIVTRSVSFFLYSILFVFLTYELVVKPSVVLFWTGHLQAGKGRGLETGGGSRSQLLVVYVGGSAGPWGFVSALRQD